MIGHVRSRRGFDGLAFLSSAIAILPVENELAIGAVPVDQHGLCERRRRCWGFALGDADGEERRRERIGGRDLPRLAPRRGCLLGRGSSAEK